MDEAKQQAMRAHRLHELKKDAIVYYQHNGVPQKMEDSLNLMFKEKPDCVFGYLSNFFEQLAAPAVISKVAADVAYDSRGVETIVAKVTCRHKNRDQQLGSFAATVQHTVYEHDKQEARDKEMEEHGQHVQTALQLVNDGPLNELEKLQIDPRKQREIDEFLTNTIAAEEQRLKEEFEKEAEEGATPEEQKDATGSPAKTKEPTGSAKKRGGKGKEVVIIPDEPREGFIPGSLSVSALSAASAKAGAEAAHLPLFQHLRRQFDPENSTWRLPLPLITILSGGKSSPGKSNCIKEYMLVPVPSLPYQQVLRDATRVYQHVAKALAVKGGPAVRFVNDVGALNVVLDRPEAGFDIINEALRNLELAESFQLAVNVAGHELFDYDKGKYDLVQGTQKSAEELADFFDDLLNKQPSIVAIIDPMRRVEKEAWMKLCHRVSERCLIVGDSGLHRPGLLLDEELSHEFQTSGWVPRLQQRTTLTEIFDCAKKMQNADNVVIPAVGPSDTNDTTIVDVAVALDARFIKIGAPVRGEKIDKFLRLIAIGQQLEQDEQLSLWEDLNFPALKLPQAETPPADKDQSSSTRSRKSSTAARH